MARLDQYLIAQGQLPSRESASEAIRAGEVLVNGKALTKPGYQVKPTDAVTYLGQGRRYVSRGAVKLLGAMETYAIAVNGCKCIDVGASTGGFTQVLLEAGAASVAAVDVGHDQLDPLLQSDPRVRDYSGLNFRDLTGHPELTDFDILTMDVSFISICLLAASVRQVLTMNGRAVILIKPQFEAGRGALNKAGVLKDPRRHEEVLARCLDCYRSEGFSLDGLRHSPITGPDGNIEYLMVLTRSEASPAGSDLPDLSAIVAGAFLEFTAARGQKGTP